MNFIDQFFACIKKAPAIARSPGPLFRCTRCLDLLFTSVFQLSTFTDTVVRLSLFEALISRMPSR